MKPLTLPAHIWVESAKRFAFFMLSTTPECSTCREAIMDNADIAQKLNEERHESALAARTTNNQPGERWCQDCGDEIQEMRRRIAGVTRCIDCQELHEKRRGEL
jgi:phage/conjugal plasmid C-4 type zinc finger TraR family protein